MPPRAVLLDFNGTLSDDEPILYSIYAELFAKHGKPLSLGDYRDQLAGYSDEEILARPISFVVSADDVVAAEPDPEGYALALGLLGHNVRAGDVLVFEDTGAGVASAKAAGMRVMTVTGTVPPEQLAQADALVKAIEAGAPAPPPHGVRHPRVGCYDLTKPTARRR